MLQLAQRTDAPSSMSVSIRMAVSMVMCNEPVMRTPLSGLSGPYFLRMDIRPGISCWQTSMVLRPHSARDKSLTQESCLVFPFPLPMAGFGALLRGGESLMAVRIDRLRVEGWVL